MSCATHCKMLVAIPHLEFSNIPCKNSSFQLPCMSLHLISMLVHTPKEVRTTMDIEHDTFPSFFTFLPLVMICLHFNPLCLQLTTWPPPLPPDFASNSFNSVMSQLRIYSVSSFFDVVCRNGDLIHMNPVRMGNLGESNLAYAYKLFNIYLHTPKTCIAQDQSSLSQDSFPRPQHSNGTLLLRYIVHFCYYC